MNYRNKFLLIVLSAFFVFYAVVGGLLGRTSAKEGAYTQLSIFNEVLSKIRNSYVEDPNLSEVMHGALRGLLESLDPYSTYLTADEYSRYKKHKTNGNGDIGLELSKEKILGYVYIIHPIEGGPAERAGLKAGDVIESIEEVSTRDISLVQAGYLLTGNIGSPVKLKILRRGKTEPLEVTAKRDQVKVPPIKTTLIEGRIGYLKIYRFTPGISEEVRAKLQHLTKSGAGKIIVDLRHCAGDEFEEAVRVANLFLDHGVITYTQGQKSPKKEFVADPSKAICKSPLVILQNYGSASAAEIVSAAIKENRRGEIVGVRSFGKASLQKLIPLENDSAILISIAKFYSQSGKVIQNNGITPDYEVRDGVDAFQGDVDSEDEEDVQRENAPGTNKPASQEDLQLKKAIELLSSPTSESQKAA
ncbi:MAG: peptidase S41 [Acidobacteria bacterium]|nr:MAG: peptidase S41 [Acidobacteriota bacterium]